MKKLEVVTQGVVLFEAFRKLAEEDREEIVETIYETYVEQHIASPFRGYAHQIIKQIMEKL